MLKSISRLKNFIERFKGAKIKFYSENQLTYKANPNKYSV